MAQLKITLKRSVIGRPQKQRKVVESLGLTKVNSTVVQPDNEAIRGMVNAISHLVDVEEN